MLIPFITSLLPQRLLDPQQRRDRDRPAAPKRTQAPARRLITFVLGGVLLASVALQTAAAFRTPDSVAAQVGTGAASDDVTTDGRAAPDADVAFATQSPAMIVTQISTNCAARARERLLTGLTHYYLQRRLRPGASSDDAADISSLTETLAGPGDPAAAVSLPSCEA